MNKEQLLKQLLSDFRTYAALDHEIALIYDRDEEPSQELLSKLAAVFSLPMQIVDNTNESEYHYDKIKQI